LYLGIIYNNIMKSGYIVLKNFLYMIFSNFVTKIGSLLTVIYLAKILGPGGFGKINFATAFLGYFSVLADFGISILALREVSQNKSQANKIVNSTLSFKIIFSILAFVLIIFCALYSNKDLLTKKLIILYGLTLFSSGTFFIAWFFQAIEEMKYLSYSLIIQSFVYIVSIFVFVKSESDLLLVPVILLISQGIAVSTHFFNLKKFIKSFKFTFTLKGFGRNLVKSTPLAIYGFLHIIGQSTPIIIIGFCLSDAAVGLFTAAQKIGILIWEVISNYVGVLFPALSKNYKEDREKMEKMMNYSIKFAFLFLLPLLVSIAVLSYSIIQLIYGDKFISSYWALKILIFTPIIMFVDSNFTNILIISDMQKTSSIIKAITTTLMIISVFLGISRFGIVGAATIIVFFTALNALIQFFYVQKTIRVDFQNAILKPVLYSTIFGAGLYYIKNFNLTLSFISAFVIYGFMIYRFKALSSEEINFIKINLSLLKSKFLSISF